MSGEDCSHSVVGWTFAALRCDPVDVLLRILDITRLAMDAVLRVDLQLTSARLTFDVLVHTCNDAEDSVSIPENRPCFVDYLLGNSVVLVRRRRAD